MPGAFTIVLAAFLGVMMLSAWFLGDQRTGVRNLSRVGLVFGGAGLFMSTMYFTSILIAVLLVCLPLAILAAWWGGLLDSIGEFFSGFWS